MTNKGVLFDEKAAAAFSETIAKYIPGDKVLLNDGAKAVVVSNTPGKMQLPAIKIIEKPGKSDIISDAVIELSKQNKISVVKVIKSARREE